MGSASKTRARILKEKWFQQDLLYSTTKAHLISFFGCHGWATCGGRLIQIYSNNSPCLLMKCYAHQGMERIDSLLFVLLFALLFGNTLGLRCYSCSTEGRTCSYTIGCHGECYKATAKRRIPNVNDKVGRDQEVTMVGCITNCSDSNDRKQACYGGENCKIDCCSSDYCNRLLSNDSGYWNYKDYPQCHSCTSVNSYEDCNTQSSLSSCSYSSGTAYCYKMDYNSLYGTKKRIYKKGCIRSYSGCDSLRTAYCSGQSSAECNVYCCSGNACNVGAIGGGSVVVSLPCAVTAFLVVVWK